VGRRHPVNDRICGPAAIGTDPTRIGLGARRRSVFKKLQVSRGGQGGTAQPDRRTRLWVQEGLRHSARDVHRHALAEGIDQAYLILDWATMTLRDRPASRQQKPDD
jgi:hypothetical protein